MEYAVYTVLIFNGQIVYEMLYCDISFETGNKLVDMLENQHPERIYFVDEVRKEHIQICLN